MILLILEKNTIKRMYLSDRYTGNYQIFNNKEEVIATIEASNQAWLITPAGENFLTKSGAKIQNDSFNTTSTYVIENQYTKEKYSIFAYDASKVQAGTYETRKGEISIGKSGGDISYSSPSMPNIKLSFKNNFWVLETDGKNVYVNDSVVRRKTLMHGDIIFVEGLKIIPYINRVIISNLY